jgi:hypothetical protein
VGPGSGPENLLGKRKSPQGVAGTIPVPTVQAAGVSAPAAGRRGGLRGSKTVHREVIVEETEEDVEDSSA